MKQSNWNFTRYENGKPVATDTDLNREQAIAAIRSAMTGEAVVSDLSARRRSANPTAAALSRAA
jgi:hypothetical protein